MNILLSLCLCKEVSNPKRMRSGIWPLTQKVWEGGCELFWQEWECTWDSSYSGCFINSSHNFCCMSCCIAHTAEPFLWQFLDSCSSQAGLLRQNDAGAFFTHQTVNNSGLEPNSQLYSWPSWYMSFLLVPRHPWIYRGDGHKLFELPHCSYLWALCAVRTARSCVCKREAVLVHPLCNMELFLEV